MVSDALITHDKGTPSSDHEKLYRELCPFHEYKMSIECLY